MSSQDISVGSSQGDASQIDAPHKRVLLLWAHILVGFVAILVCNTSQDGNVSLIALIAILTLQVLTLQNSNMSRADRLVYAGSLLLICAACFIAPMVADLNLPEATLLSLGGVLPFLLWMMREFVSYRRNRSGGL